MTAGWLIPLPSPPVKSDEDLRREREAKVEELRRRGLLQRIEGRAPHDRAVLLFRLELDGGAGTIRGTLEHRDGTREPFWGWLELMALLERAQVGEDRSSASSGGGPSLTNRNERPSQRAPSS